MYEINYFFLPQRFQAFVVIAVHGVVVSNLLALEVNTSQRPVHAQMYGHEEQIIGEYINTSSPSLERSVTVLAQLRVEESIQRVCFHLVVLAAIHDHAHVEIYDLIVEPVETLERLHVLSRDAKIEGSRKNVTLRIRTQSLTN